MTSRKRTLLRVMMCLFVAAPLTGIATAGAAVLLTDRTSLVALLDGSAVTEDFERFFLGSAPELVLPTELDSSTVLPGQGPGLVVDGVKFSGFTHLLSIENLDYLGQSQALAVGGVFEKPLLIDFSGSVDAFGFDFLPSALTGENIELVVLAADDATVLNSLILPIFFFPTFVGVRESALIGAVKITSFINPPFNDLRIDNLTFGTVKTAPEPSTIWLLILGAGAVVAMVRGTRVGRSENAAQG
jgi:hypothetical protein